MPRSCWWGAIRILVFAAFYGVNAAAAPISLTDAVTYVWLGQALLALQPWVADPEIGQAVRTGGVGYDRLRPLDAYGYWYARTLGWMLARALPRAVLMLLAAGIVLPLVGLGDWAWRPPSGVTAALLFVPAFALMTALGAAVLMLANIIVAASLNERGVNAVLTPLVIVFSGSLLPLDFYPRRPAALPARAAVRRPGRHPVPHLLRRPARAARPCRAWPCRRAGPWCWSASAAWPWSA